MSAYLAGLDLVGLLLQVSLGEKPMPAPDSREGVRPHLAMQVLLGCASRGGTRRDMIGECWRLIIASRPYAVSAEELTPVRLDWISAVPLAMIAITLLAAPKLGEKLASGGWGSHLLDIASIRRIEREDFPPAQQLTASRFPGLLQDACRLFAGERRCRRRSKPPGWPRHRTGRMPVRHSQPACREGRPRWRPRAASG